MKYCRTAEVTERAVLDKVNLVTVSSHFFFFTSEEVVRKKFRKEIPRIVSYP